MLEQLAWMVVLIFYPKEAHRMYCPYLICCSVQVYSSNKQFAYLMLRSHSNFYPEAMSSDEAEEDMALSKYLL